MVGVATADHVCWRCGASIAGEPLPLSRFAECAACRASLHVCRQCEYYDTRVAKHCREPIAEEVKDKDRANFCDYLKARPQAYRPPDAAARTAAAADLNALFGLGAAPAPSAPADPQEAALQALFGATPPDPKR